MCDLMLYIWPSIQHEDIAKSTKHPSFWFSVPSEVPSNFQNHLSNNTLKGISAIEKDS
jgi:hypothetical protein